MAKKTNTTPKTSKPEFKIKESKIKSLRDLISKSNVKNAEEFLKTDAFKAWFAHPPIAMSATEKQFVTEIVDGIYKGLSNADIISSIKLLWSAWDPEKSLVESDDIITVDFTIGDDTSTDSDIIKDTLILEDKALKTDGSEDDATKKLTAIKDAVTALDDALKGLGVDLSMFGVDITDIDKALTSIDDVISSEDGTTSEGENGTTETSTAPTAPDFSACKNMHEVMEAARKAAADGYEGVVKNPLYGKKYVAPYGVNDIKAASLNERMTMRYINGAAQSDQKGEYIVIKSGSVTATSESVAKISAQRHGLEMPKNDTGANKPPVTPTAPDFRKCTNMHEVMEEAKRSRDTGYEGIVRNPLYGEEYSSPYKDGDTTTLNKRLERMVENGPARMNQESEFIVITEFQVFSAHGAVAKIMADKYGFTMPKSDKKRAASKKTTSPTAPKQTAKSDKTSSLYGRIGVGPFGCGAAPKYF